VDQSVSSNARRAAAMARSMSAAEASATGPSTSSVAGLTLSNVAPDSACTSSPSISIRVSPWTVLGRSVSVVAIEDKFRRWAQRADRRAGPLRLYAVR
jgi:hypothetical protein